MQRNQKRKRRFTSLGRIAPAVFLLSGLAPNALAGDVLVMAGGANARIDVQSVEERKFATTVRQQYDFSCGSAAVATLLTYHYDRKTSETDAFQAMWAIGDHDRIRQLGFSLFEMKSYLESIGLLADGFQMTLERVESIGVPGIALIDVDGYKHFVVIKGVSKTSVLFGDPSKGIVVKSRKEFEAIWDGVILFIRSDVQKGKKSFNARRDWKLTPVAPTGAAQNPETLQSFLLNQTRTTSSGFSISTFTTPM